MAVRVRRRSVIAVGIPPGEVRISSLRSSPVLGSQNPHFQIVAARSPLGAVVALLTRHGKDVATAPGMDPDGGRRRAFCRGSARRVRRRTTGVESSAQGVVRPLSGVAEPTRPDAVATLA